MISILFAHSFQFAQTYYNLVPPFHLTDINEIGNWTICGTANVMKSGIRLTSNVPNSFGGICQRVPTLFKEWTAEAEVTAHGGEDPGHGIWIFFTEEVCPAFALTFTGFSLWINTTSTDSQGLSNVYFAKNNGSELMLKELVPIGKVNVRGEDRKPLRIQMSRKHGYITIESVKDGKTQTLINTNDDLLPDYGYFSISAVTGTKSDNNDLVAFRIYPISSLDHPNATFDYSTVNRKYIENAKKTRRELKKKRRNNMPKMTNYSKESNENDLKLNGQTKTDLHDAINIIDEAYNRGLETITLEHLDHYISDTVETSINKALSQIELAANRYTETQQDIDELWSSLRSQLLEIAIEERNTLEKIKQEVFELAKQMNLAKIDMNKVQQGLDSEVNQIDDGPKIMILMIISGIEIVAYVIFFIYKRSTTNNFKKYD